MPSQALPLIDLLAEERFSALGPDPLVWHDAACPRDNRAPGAIHIAIDRLGTLPRVDHDAFDILLSTAHAPPAPWVGIAPTRINAHLHAMERTVANAPAAATMLAQLLRLTGTMSFDGAIEVESLVYSTLLGGGEFARWLAKREPTSQCLTTVGPLVEYSRDGHAVKLALAAPESRNEMSAAMRDSLFDALVNVIEDPTCPAVTLTALGRCFSVGGALGEFGTAPDLATAHIVRCRRSNARLLHRLGPRATVLLHGACIGSGIEIAAAAQRRVATQDCWVQLPELSMGLIPGAGGTVTIPRAIGRHRACWLMLGGVRLNASLALEWGLFHELAP
jgi:hypothetical protein